MGRQGGDRLDRRLEDYGRRGQHRAGAAVQLPRREYRRADRRVDRRGKLPRQRREGDLRRTGRGERQALHLGRADGHEPLRYSEVAGHGDRPGAGRQDRRRLGQQLLHRRNDSFDAVSRPRVGRHLQRLVVLREARNRLDRQNRLRLRPPSLAILPDDLGRRQRRSLRLLARLRPHLHLVGRPEEGDRHQTLGRGAHPQGRDGVRPRLLREFRADRHAASCLPLLAHLGRTLSAATLLRRRGGDDAGQGCRDQRTCRLRCRGENRRTRDRAAVGPGGLRRRALRRERSHVHRRDGDRRRQTGIL